jgi:tRNA dimethylallyltransferase
LIVVLGPTGSGKSDLGLELAEAYRGEIVNCDSVQLYRYLDIGTAKIPTQERRGVPHHLIDILEPEQIFTAGDYVRLARPLLREISERGHTPIVVGGTGFYVRALLTGLFEGPRRDASLRRRLSERSSESLHKLLRRLDPASAGRIHPNDTNKLIRALEVCILTRRPLSAQFEYNRRPLAGFTVIKIGLDPPREVLSAYLNKRCYRMFEQGLIDEVRRIVAMGFGPNSKALESIGYREAVLHIEGRLTVEQALAETQTNTRQYAKRQRTWFRRESDVYWIRDFGNKPETVLEAKCHVRRFMEEMA